MKKYLLLLLLPVFAFAQEHDPAAIEKAVKEAFKDTPIMVEVARCESRFRQFADSGNVMRGGTDKKMIGIFQIYDDVHRTTAKSMDMDIDTVEGNIKYAQFLYKREGTTPWISSMPCWDPHPEKEQNGKETLDISLRFGMVHPEVVTLQRILNRNGYIVAKEGQGSPGNETTLFGNFTRAAVKKFQCDQRIVCEGDEYTTAYGVVGPRTREALLKFSPVTMTVAEEIAYLEKKIEELKKKIAELEASV